LLKDIIDKERLDYDKLIDSFRALESEKISLEQISE
jgi:hypothetical protein